MNRGFQFVVLLLTLVCTGSAYISPTTTIFGYSPSAQLTETLSWTGDGLLATHVQARGDFTDNRSYAYASQNRRLVDEWLNLDATKTWTNHFTFDGYAGVLIKAGPEAINSVRWLGALDGFSRVNLETNPVLRHAAYGRVNAYSADATVEVTVDGQPQPVTVITTGVSNYPTQWRAMLELTPGAHQISASARHGFSAFTSTTNRWFTNTAAQITRSNVFDAAGQITQRTWRNPNGTTNRTHTLTWDAVGRLLKVVERDSTQSGLDWTAVYDPLGRRWRTVETPVTNGNVLTAQTRTNASWFDPEVEFLEVGVSVDGRIPTWKLHGPDADGEFGSLNGRGGFDAIVPGPELFCPVLSDLRGDVLAVYDPDHGHLRWNTNRPSAYGGVPGRRPLPLGRGADVVQASGHAGIWPDATGYYWRGARYYDPESGQWLSYDPYGLAAGDQPYGYLPDPINYTDPDGRFGQGFFAGGGGLAGGGGFAGGGGGLPPSSHSWAYNAGHWAGSMVNRGNRLVNTIGGLNNAQSIQNFAAGGFVRLPGAIAGQAGGIARTVGMVGPYTGLPGFSGPINPWGMGADALEMLGEMNGQLNRDLAGRLGANTDSQEFAAGEDAADVGVFAGSLFAGGGGAAGGGGRLVSRAANAGVRFSRAGRAGSDFLIASEEALQAGLRDPALYGTRLTKTPTFNPALTDYGVTIGRGLKAQVQVGPAAFSSRQQLLNTIIHEETHIRLDLRTARGSHRADLIQSARLLEEDYVRRVADRFVRRFGDR